MTWTKIKLGFIINDPLKHISAQKFVVDGQNAGKKVFLAKIQRVRDHIFITMVFNSPLSRIQRDLDSLVLPGSPSFTNEYFFNSQM